MKLQSLFLALFISLAGAVFAAEAMPLTFNGILTIGSDQRFGLVNDSGTRTAWQKLGTEFEGYTLKSFDEEARTLTVERGGKTYTLLLAGAGMTGSAAAQTGATKAELADAEAVIGQMRLEEMIRKSIDQQKKMMLRMTEQMLSRSGTKVAAEDLQKHQDKVMDTLMEAMNPAQMEKDMTQIYADTFSKEELTAMGDFYTTPAGQALLEKQPAIQQKLQELMMPRIMSAMPKIQELSAEFASEQKTKAAAQQAAPAPAETK